MSTCTTGGPAGGPGRGLLIKNSKTKTKTKNPASRRFRVGTNLALCGTLIPRLRASLRVHDQFETPSTITLKRASTITEIRSERMETNNKRGEISSRWTGATISRIDFTQNYCTGGPDEANHFIRWLGSQKLKGKETLLHKNGQTVDFGSGSKRSYFKIYNKGYELLKHSKAKTDVSTIQKTERADSIEKLADWCQSTGLVRAELELKSKLLHDLHCYYLGEINMNVIEAEFKRHTAVFERSTAELDSMSQLDGKTLAVYRMWQAGDDLSTKFKKSMLYAYRKALLPHGIDIFIPSNVIRFEPKTRVIALSAAVPPDWYAMPAIQKAA